MLLKPNRPSYQWIYAPDKHYLLFLPLLENIDSSAKNLLFKIFKSLDLDEFLAFLNGQESALQSYACLADKQTFLGLIQYLKPKWVASCADITLNAPQIYEFPHPNTWHQDGLMKKRIWLACHDLKYKVL